MLAIILLLTAPACDLFGPRPVRVSLIKTIADADKQLDGDAVVFGTPGARGRLLKGWSDPERHKNETFQWANDRDATFVFKGTTERALYMHMMLRSFFTNTVQVLINNTPLSTFRVEDDQTPLSVRVPDSMLSKDNNLVELRFAETRQSPGSDNRQLAAAAYYALLSRSKYVGAGTDVERFWDAGKVFVRKKEYPALFFNAGGTFHYYERLTPRARLSFGTYLHQSPMAEGDDYTQFSVVVRGDHMGEKRIFDKRLTADAAGFQEIELPYDKRDSIYDIELHVARNSVFGDTRAAWLDPAISYAPPPAPRRPQDSIERIRKANRGANVIIMLLDAGSANHFGCYGYARNATPNIDALARQNTRFEREYCQAVYTLSSTASLMSGLYPYHHHVTVRRSRMPDEAYTLAEVFDNNGYRTGTFVANGNASGIFGMTQGFEKIEEVFRARDYSGWAKDVTNKFFQWVETRPQPFFAYLHYREPHAPFNPPPEWFHRFTDPAYDGAVDASYETRNRINRGELKARQADKDYIEALYDANLAYGDYEVGRVLQKLRELGIDRNTIVIVTADHGEAFWEHGFQGHNSQLYQESSHIPLVMRLAGVPPGKIPGLVRTIDMYPTLVDILGLSERGIRVDGRSVLSYLAGGQPDGREAIIHNLGESQFAYLDGDYKYILGVVGNTEELYNLKDDPTERVNIAKQEPVRASYYRTQLLRRVSASSKVAAWKKTEKAVLDNAAGENLKALGYISTE